MTGQEEVAALFDVIERLDIKDVKRRDQLKTWADNGGTLETLLVLEKSWQDGEEKEMPGQGEMKITKGQLQLF